jgi:hypothetical protein
VVQTAAGCPPNSFFNGYECTCEVGYSFVSGKCVAISISTPIPVIINNQGNSGQPSTPSTPTSNGTSPSNNGNIQTNTQNNSQTSNTSNQGGSTSDNQTTTIPNYSPVVCGSNSYDNGLGTCVCQSGFFFSNYACVAGTPCAAGSTRQADGSCKCDAGLTNYGGYCSKCPNGAIFSSQSNSCIYVCGQNSAYDQGSAKCVCNSGYGLLNGVCDQCPSGYFVSAGYCVTCPVNSVYNLKTLRCDCSDGYYTNQVGICTKKCGTN